MTEPTYDPAALASLDDFHQKYSIDQRPAVVHPKPEVSGHYGHPVMAFLDLVEAETIRAAGKHPALHSAHEAYAVILEELDEFKTEVWKQTARRDRAAMLAELVQIAAMATRTAVDLGLIGESSADGLADCV
jgi:hypothetical protein